MDSKVRTNSNFHSNGSKTTNNDKLVILTFGDTIKNQITTVKPILDQYGFKASFFITCEFANRSSTEHHRMNWNMYWHYNKMVRT